MIWAHACLHHHHCPIHNVLRLQSWLGNCGSFSCAGSLEILVQTGNARFWNPCLVADPNTRHAVASPGSGLGGILLGQHSKGILRSTHTLASTRRPARIYIYIYICVHIYIYHSHFAASYLATKTSIYAHPTPHASSVRKKHQETPVPLISLRLELMHD